MWFICAVFVIHQKCKKCNFFVMLHWIEHITFSHANRKIFHMNDLGICSGFIILNGDLKMTHQNTSGHQKWLVIFKGPEFE